MKHFTIGPTNHTFSIEDPARARVQGTVPFTVFNLALDVLNDLASKTATLMNDSHLSPEGREHSLKPLREAAWSALAAGYIRLGEFDAAIATREAALLQVPKLDPTHSACAVEDAECRAWYRSQSLSERTAVMNAMQNDPAAGQTFYRLQIALLRSPVPLPADHETAFFAALWKQTKRIENPGEAIAIDADRNSNAYGMRGLAHVQGIMSSVSGWARDELLSWLVLVPARIGAAKALGFNPTAVALAKQAQQAAKRIAAFA